MQESESGEVTLHDDDVAAIASVLRYIVELEEATISWSIGLWYTLEEDLGEDYTPSSEHDWLPLSAFAADKYMVDGLCQLIVQELKITCDWKFSYSAKGQASMSQELFVYQHYQRCKELWGGQYPKLMCPVFLQAHKKFRRSGLPVDKMNDTILRDHDLEHYCHCNDFEYWNPPRPVDWNPPYPDGTDNATMHAALGSITVLNPWSYRISDSFSGW